MAWQLAGELGLACAGFVDRLAGSKEGLSVITESQFRELKAPQYFVAVGDPHLRGQLTEKAKQLAPGAELISLVSPHAMIGPGVNIGAGTCVMPRAVLNAYAEVGESCILNTGCIVEHDVWVGRLCNLGPGSVLGGQVELDDHVSLGIQVSVQQGVRISRGIVVGFYSLVTKNLEKSGMYWGSPAIWMKDYNLEEGYLS